MVNRGYNDTWVALLLMKLVKLLQEIEFGSGRRFDGVETLKSSSETESLPIRTFNACQLSTPKNVKIATFVSATKGMFHSAGGITLQIPYC